VPALTAPCIARVLCKCVHLHRLKLDLCLESQPRFIQEHVAQVRAADHLDVVSDGHKRTYKMAGTLVAALRCLQALLPPTDPDLVAVTASRCAAALRPVISPDG
jgi:hypothetical protein